MTKTLATLLTLSLAACGSVTPTGADGDGDDGSPGSDTGSDMGSDQPDAGTPDTTPAPISPIVLEAPHAATTPNAISGLGHATRRKVADLILGTFIADISEQRFLTVGDQPFVLTVQLASTPTADVSRTISMDTNTTIIHTTQVNIQCSFDHSTILGEIGPGCNMVNAPETDSVTNPMTSATWSVSVFDEATMMAVACEVNAGVQSCTLPGGAGHAYRIVTSVTGVSELWNGEPVTAYEGTGGYVGLPENVLYCSDYRVSNGDWWCTLDLTYRRDRGIDNASIAFGDIDVTVAANGFTSMTPAAQLSWTYADEDLPGDHY